ncbi:hypothetical protein QTP88_016566 [Uroleucon formosanum]
MTSIGKRNGNVLLAKRAGVRGYRARWTAKAESIKAVWILYEIILEALQVMSSAQKLDKSTRTQAFGLSKKMLSFDFIIALYFMKNIMYKMKILTEKLEVIELNNLLPNVNMMLRLVFTAPISTASNERAFSKLKLVKNYLRFSISADRLHNLMLLNSNKDILDNVNITMLVDKWSLLKERRIIM